MNYNYLDIRIKNRIEEELKVLVKLRPLPAPAIKKLREQFQIEMTYNSNAIEGNSLTLKETFLVINEGITIKGKPLKDHLEAKDHNEALNYIYDLIDSKKALEVTEGLIRDIHKIIMQKTDEGWAGKYRSGQVIILGADHVPPQAVEVPLLMQKLIDWYRNNKNKYHIVELASLMHHKLVYIHPFFDGNGRTARLLMNILLMQKGYPLTIILKNDRPKYYRLLEQADKEILAPLIQFIAQAVERSLTIYLRALQPAPKKEAKLILLSEAAKRYGYSEKHLNLLARTGRIKAYKERRNWVTTAKSIEEYINIKPNTGCWRFMT